MIILYWQKKKSEETDTLMYEMKNGSTLCRTYQNYTCIYPFPASLILGIYPKIYLPSNSVCVRLFTVASLEIAKYCKQPKYSSIGDWLNEHTMKEVKKEKGKPLYIDMERSP